MLALTGTAIPGDYDSVVKKLSMKNAIVAELSQNHDNIKYYLEPPLAVKKFCELFTEKIRCYHMGCPTTLTSCSSTPESSLIY